MKKTINTINKEQARELIKNTNGTIFSVKFKKKNNQLRTLNGRLGVKSKLRGGFSTTSHIDKYITVYDMNINDYRNINIDTLQSLSTNGKKYEII